MSTIGANVQWMPTARASRAATAWPSLDRLGSQDAAIAIGTGKIGAEPWMTSKPNSTRDPEPRLLDRDLLQRVELLRVVQPQDGAGAALADGARRVHSRKRAHLRELADLFR